MADAIRPISQAIVTDTVGATTGSAEQQEDSINQFVNGEDIPFESDGLQTIKVEALRTDFSSISNFLAQNRVTGFAKAHKFLVRFSGNIFSSSSPNSPFSQLSALDLSQLLTFKCEQAEFPGRDFLTSDSRIYGPIYKTPHMSNYQDINLTLICDNSLTQKQLFQSWMNFINSSFSFDFEYRDNYVCDVEIEHYNELNKRTFGCTLYGAFPISVASLQGNWADDNFHKLQVTLTYNFWNSRIYGANDIQDYEELKTIHDLNVKQAAESKLNKNFFKNTNLEHLRKIAKIGDDSRSNFRSVIDSLENE